MTGTTKPRWERFSDAMVDWCGYVLLAVATVLGVIAGDGGPSVAADDARASPPAAAAWIYVLYTRLPRPRQDHRLRIVVFFVGLLVFASVLMLRQPLFFIFMISGFFYASILRPLPLAVVGVAATSILVNTLIAGFPQTAGGVDLLPRHSSSSRRPCIGGGVVVGEKVAEQNEERRQALAELEAAPMRTPAFTPSC